MHTQLYSVCTWYYYSVCTRCEFNSLPNVIKMHEGLDRKISALAPTIPVARPPVKSWEVCEGEDCWVFPGTPNWICPHEIFMEYPVLLLGRGHTVIISYYNMQMFRRRNTHRMNYETGSEFDNTYLK
jgi:hypothetical protein